MKTDFINAFLLEAESIGLRRTLRPVEQLSARECMVNGKKYLNFSSNNYLALAEHPYLKSEAIKWLERYGNGSGASRLVTGTNPALLELEKRIADWKKTEAALLLGSGYTANIGLLPALAGRDTIILGDRLNHASLNSGCQLAAGKFMRYRHLDFEQLDEFLSKYPEAGKLIVSDTVFSMDGDIAEVEKLSKLAAKHDALLYLDDAHATGVFGGSGEGLSCGKSADVTMGTFSKGMGSYGAYVACSADFKEYFINRCGSFIYTTALPPAVCGAISAAIELVQTDEYHEIRMDLKRKFTFLNTELVNLGYDTGDSKTPVIPVILGEAEEVIEFSNRLFEQGILAMGIRPPTVPVGSSRIRLSLNAGHTDEDIYRLLELMTQLKS
jgi:8-amino-7-oxononanoate synthase